MSHVDKYVVFRAGDQRLAIELSTVERIVRMVEVTPIPNLPDRVLGVINVQGRIAPVLSLTRRENTWKETDINGQFIIARAANRTVAIVASAVEGLIEGDAQKDIAGNGRAGRVLKLDDSLVLIQDLEPLAKELADCAVFD